MVTGPINPVGAYTPMALKGPACPFCIRKDCNADVPFICALASCEQRVDGAGVEAGGFNDAINAAI